MRHRYSVLLVLLLAQVGNSPEAFAQRTDLDADSSRLGQDPQEEIRGVVLEQNYPNPFNTETRIPFVLAPDLFEDGRSVVVTVRVFNVLRQHIATPIIADHPFASGQPAIGVTFDRAGRYELLWDGNDSGGHRVASGIYFCQIAANGSRDVIKMIVRR